MTDFARPTLSDILERIQSDIDSQLEGTDSRLRRSVLSTLAYMEAGSIHGLYGYIEFLSKQIFPDTAESEYLARWGVIWGVERLQAIQAKGNVTITGIDGTVIPAGTELQRSDLALFTVDASATIASGTVTTAVTAYQPGIDGNTEAGSTFTFVSPISGADSDVTVAVGGIANGVDIEDDDSYLERILLKIQQPPQGGAAIDYEIWAKAASSAVTNVWVTPTEDGPGTVKVRFMSYGVGNGIPTSDLITTVQDYIDSKKPVTAIATVVAPTADTFDFTIELTINAGYVLADVKDAVQANLEDMLRRDAEPGGTIYKARIIDNVLSTPGVFTADVTVPSSEVTASTGHIPVMGTITWV